MILSKLGRINSLKNRISYINNNINIKRNVSSTVHIHNLQLTIKREDLQLLCNEFGVVTSCKFLYDYNLL